MKLRISTLSLLLAGAAGAANTTPVTFHKDVQPILQRSCQGCHRPGEAAPMAFTSFKEVRPWAKAIKTAVAVKKMPPWYADPHYGKFSNERSLSESEIRTLVSWADAGAPEGNPTDAPAPASFIDGWNIARPDQVFEMPSVFEVPASGTLEYNYVVLPTGFTKDTWVQAAEVRPGNRQLVHHVIAFIRPPGSKWLQDAKPGVPFVPARVEKPARKPDSEKPAEKADDSGGMAGVELLVGYAPGLQEQKFLPGQGRLVPAGADIVLQLHYTANGKPGTDRTRVGVVYCKQEPKQRIVTLTATNAKFEIPAGDANYEVTSQFTVQDNTELVWLMPHMHLRGKDFEYRAVYPTGETQVLLRVPRYDFNWQLAYETAQPVILPKGLASNAPPTSITRPITRRTPILPR